LSRRQPETEKTVKGNPKLVETLNALLADERTAIKAYNSAIVVAGDAADFATREVLEEILEDKDRHIDEIEALQDQVRQMTLSVFLSIQIGQARCGRGFPR
jgi:bacterioferritin (cytochrome b1)